METNVDEKVLIRDSNRENLIETFDSYLKKQVDGEPKRILSVGCSFGYEARPILGVFPTANFKGIDINKKFIEVARDENPDLGNAIFQEGDATKKETFGEEPWDLVLIRHPQVCREMFPADPKQDVAKNWEIIMQNSMEALRKGGTLFVSTITADERSVVLGYIKSSEEKMEVRVNRRNEFDANRVFDDLFIIVAKKDNW